jgi:hypothetical protein
METRDSIEARAGRVQDALHNAFGVKGKSLAVALNRKGRRLPKRLQSQARRVADAQAISGHPKLMRQVDGAALRRAEDQVVTYLRGIDRSDRRKGFWLGIAGAVAFNVLVVTAGFIIWMWWAGKL